MTDLVFGVHFGDLKEGGDEYVCPIVNKKELKITIHEFDKLSDIKGLKGSFITDKVVSSSLIVYKLKNGLELIFSNFTDSIVPDKYIAVKSLNYDIKRMVLLNNFLVMDTPPDNLKISYVNVATFIEAIMYFVAHDINPALSTHLTKLRDVILKLLKDKHNVEPDWDKYNDKGLLKFKRIRY